MSFLSRTVLAPLVPVIGQRAVLGLSGYVINNIGFMFAAVYLYRLSVVILKDQEAAVRASVLFCFNPASIYLFINIFGDIVRPFFSWRIVPSNIWKRCHCCSLVCSFGIFKVQWSA
ncbi:hypothetical protein C1H46_001466 [Malus baccata]|uniref:GPI mannosyltransferase 2 n=1 Tax=Malus baccata TaxID=106549 RepID=A0A540NQK5_MALBA|nr:hypothetical protein C1H46_001466 [Malus baccata]